MVRYHIKNKKSGSVDTVTEAAWKAMQQVEPGQSFTLAELFDVVEIIQPVEVPAEVAIQLEKLDSKRKTKA